MEPTDAEEMPLPSPNIMGQDRMRIIERKLVKPAPPSQAKPFEVVITHEWEVF